MLGSAVIRYRREMRLLQRFTLETRIAAWSDTTAVMEQTFLIASGPQKGQMAARALVKAGFYDRKDRSFVTVKRLIAELGLPDQETESPPLTPEIEAFLKAETLLRPQVGGDAYVERLRSDEPRAPDVVEREIVDIQNCIDPNPNLDDRLGG